MDKVFDFFKDLKERISSPFFSSFLISWITLNWMFLVTIFKYDTTGFTLSNFIVYLKYSSTLLKFNHYFLYPFLLALVYSFLYPFLRTAIEVADVWFKTRANDKKIEVSRTSKITIEKYMKLREIYEDRTKTLEEVLKKESETIEKNEKLLNDLNKLKQENNELRESISNLTMLKNDLENKVGGLNHTNESLKIQLGRYLDKEDAKRIINRKEFLNGKWKLETSGILNEIFRNKRLILFDDGIAYEIDEFEVAREWFKIITYEYNDITKNITITSNLKINETELIFKLIPNKSRLELVGQTSIKSRHELKFIRIPDETNETQLV